MEGIAGGVSSGRLHPSEIAGRLAREADLARFEHEAGPATANSFTILVNPKNLTTNPAEMEAALRGGMEEYAAEHGLRLEGPIQVSIASSANLAPGKTACHVKVTPGPPVVWAQLTSTEGEFAVGRNRSIVGRADTSDVLLPFEDISRAHTLIWREGGMSHIKDLGSFNGTFVNGDRIGAEPARIDTGSVVTVASHTLRFVKL